MKTTKTHKDLHIFNIRRWLLHTSGGKHNTEKWQRDCGVWRLVWIPFGMYNVKQLHTWFRACLLYKQNELAHTCTALYSCVMCTESTNMCRDCVDVHAQELHVLTYSSSAFACCTYRTSFVCTMYIRHWIDEYSHTKLTWWVFTWDTSTFWHIRYKHTAVISMVHDTCKVNPTWGIYAMAPMEELGSETWGSMKTRKLLWVVEAKSHENALVHVLTSQTPTNALLQKPQKQGGRVYVIF